MKRIMVDMSATLIHHGHIRLLREASKYGYVIVALTTDQEIHAKKGYEPELDFSCRREILESVRFVDEVVASPWLIEESFLDQHKIDLLVHGDDNSNPVSSKRLLILPRTSGISSSLLRVKVLRTAGDSCINL
ncbi:adenylyltransferase/cytidyltransferase family protein [Vulcanococcus sp.]|jgi:cytidyltransferase-like protein|uniref:adenylyltransferase/cytidyltransferase family protein n=1 Tax=Vulcanococcus sp. TaxID=2856995 RepID=UPI00343D6DA4